jgi:hypothetical protein
MTLYMVSSFLLTRTPRLSLAHQKPAKPRRAVALAKEGTAKMKFCIGDLINLNQIQTTLLFATFALLTCNFAQFREEFGKAIA